MSGSATLKWVALALVGLAIASGVAIAASRLASERIGIASESVSAGKELAPAIDRAAARGAEQRGNRARGNEQQQGPRGNDRPAAEEPAQTTDPPTETNEPGPGGESADATEDRIKAEEDAAEDRLKAEEDLRDAEADAAEDRRKAEEDARDD